MRERISRQESYKAPVAVPAAVASLVFGEGELDRHALYATSTFRGGGKIWKIDVGVEDPPLFR